jgi:endogenous inhibitor of DNA gyrase (YacG/DUF329 family)
MSTKTDKICCPTCNQPGTWNSDNSFKPFCSHRCKLIDLGEWADDSRVISGESINLDTDDEENEH